MLHGFDRFEDMDFNALMKLYREGNLENGAYFYPAESKERQLTLAEQDCLKYLKQDFFAKPGVRYWVWEEGGAYISALRLEPMEQGLLLEALETEPSHRCRGYARALLAAVLRELPKDSTVYSVVSDDNEASLRAHKSCGFLAVPMPPAMAAIYDSKYYVTLSVTT